MPDPFSVASGAAGIISLGLSVCQGLVWYYQGWDDWEDNVRSAMQEVEDVFKFLKLLEYQLDKLSIKQAEIIFQSRSLASRFEEVVGKLNDILNRCKAVPPQDGQKHRLKNLARHTLYPFKKSTLKELVEAVGQAREGLTSVLQLLQIDLSEVNRLEIEGVKAETARICGTVIDTRSKVNQTHATVESIEAQTRSIHDAVAAARNAVEPVSRIESGVNEVAANTKEILSILKTELDGKGGSSIPALFTGLQPLDERLGRIELALSTLISSGEIPNNESHITSLTALRQETRNVEVGLLQKPAVLRLACAAVENSSQRLAVAQHRRWPRECFCHRYRRHNESQRRFGSLRFTATTTDVIQHSRNCRFWNTSESRSKELAFSFLTSVLNTTIQVSLGISHGAGGLSISPLLNLRRLVVQSDAPVFALFHYRTIRKYENNLGDYFEYASCRMLRLFQDGSASPFDVNEYGETILDAALQNLRWFVDCGSIDRLRPLNVSVDDHANAFRKMILSFITSGVPLNETNCHKQTPLDVIMDMSTSTQQVALAMDLENAGAVASGGWYSPWEMQFIVQLDSWCESTNCGPLSRAVAQQDEHRVIQILEDAPYAIEELNSKGQSPLHLASIWSRGTELLLHNKKGRELIGKTDKRGTLPISYAIANKCFESFKLLLNAGSPLSPKEMYPYSEEQVIEFAACFGGPRSMAMAVQALRTRRKQLYDFAKEQLPINVWRQLRVPSDRIPDRDAKRIQEALIGSGVIVPDELWVGQEAATVYHIATMDHYIYKKFTVKKADVLFEAGFRDVNSPSRDCFTPLEDICRHGVDLVPGLDLINWFLAKGADLCQIAGSGRIQLVQNVSGFHMVAFFVGRSISYEISNNRDMLQGTITPLLDALSVDSQALIRNVFREYRSDACICACATGGCSPVTALLEPISKFHRIESDCCSLREQVISWIEGDCAEEWTPKLPLQVVEDVIRSQTFEVLGLTHTCCDINLGGELIPRCDPSEAAEIREEELELRQELEELVSRFVQVYKRGKESLGSFLRGHWRTEMARVLTTHEPPKPEQISELRRIGVVLENADKHRDTGKSGHALHQSVEETRGPDPKDTGNTAHFNCCHGNGDDEQPAHEIPNQHSEIPDKEWRRILKRFSRR